MRARASVHAHALTEALSIVHSDCERRWWLTCCRRGQFAGLAETCWDERSRDNSVGAGQKQRHCENAFDLNETRWRNHARTMHANCLMQYGNTAITLNGNSGTKHYGSRQKGKRRVVLFLFSRKCLSRLAGAQGLWHRNNLFYYNTRKRRVLRAFWATQAARYNPTVWALKHLISTHLRRYLMGRTSVWNRNLFKNEMIGLRVMMDGS